MHNNGISTYWLMTLEREMDTSAPAGVWSFYLTLPVVRRRQKRGTYQCWGTSEAIMLIASAHIPSCPVESPVVEHEERQPAVRYENRLKRVRLYDNNRYFLNISK